MTVSDEELSAPWGLSRISHRDLASSTQSHDYVYRSEAGSNVTAYVIDTGIHIHHEDFEGRAEWGVTIPKNDPDQDGNGHGTHVAGTICGRKFGVAKKAHVVAVKVLRSNGSGSMSDVLKGIEWVLLRHRSLTSRGKKVKSVANMSLGGGKSRILDQAVNKASYL
jgi:cerevisin